MMDPEWQEFVEHEIEAIESLMRIEHEELISKPRLVRRIMKERRVPEMYAMLQREEFKDLYGTIAYLLTERYINDEILGEAERVGPGERADELTQGLVDWIHENSRLEDLIGIRIKEMESSVKNISYLSWQNEIRKRENLF